MNKAIPKKSGPDPNVSRVASSSDTATDQGGSMGNGWRTVYRSRDKRVLRRNGGAPPHRRPSRQSEWISASALVGGGLVLAGLVIGGFTGFGMLVVGGAVMFKLL